MRVYRTIGPLVSQNEAHIKAVTDRFILILISGQRFHYTCCDKSYGEIWQSIEALDRMVSDSCKQ